MGKRKGMALVTVILMLFVVSSMMAIIYTYFMVNLQATIRQQNRVRAYFCALGGIEIGTSILRSNVTLAQLQDPVTLEDTRTVTLADLYKEFDPLNPNDFRVNHTASGHASNDFGYDLSNPAFVGSGNAVPYITSPVTNGVGFLTIPNDVDVDPILYYQTEGNPSTPIVGRVSISIWLDTRPPDPDGKQWIRLMAFGEALDANGDVVGERIEYKSFNLQNVNDNNTINWN